MTDAAAREPEREKRYAPKVSTDGLGRVWSQMVEDVAGEWVPWADHVRERERLQRELAEQRAELNGQLSEAFQAIPTCYETPADHYRELARRINESRDSLKHENRKLRDDLTAKEGEQERLIAENKLLKAEIERLVSHLTDANRNAPHTRGSYPLGYKDDGF